MQSTPSQQHRVGADQDRIANLGIVDVRPNTDPYIVANFGTFVFQRDAKMQYRVVPTAGQYSLVDSVAKFPSERKWHAGQHFRDEGKIEPVATYTIAQKAPQ